MSSRRLSLLLPLLVLATAGLPAAAHADVTFDRPCYQDTYAEATASFTATGLPADAVVRVALDGKELGVARTDATGTVTRTIPVPAHAGAAEEGQHALTVTSEDGRSVSGMLYTSSLTAGFSPTRGDARTLKVRFRVYGMNLLEPSRVYAHYVAPNGKHRKTVALGAAEGPCGRLIAAKKVRLFPFAPQAGRWTLQFDTRKRYARGTNASKYPWATVGVRVAAARR